MTEKSIMTKSTELFRSLKKNFAVCQILVSRFCKIIGNCNLPNVTMHQLVTCLN